MQALIGIAGTLLALGLGGLLALCAEGVEASPRGRTQPGETPPDRRERLLNLLVARRRRTLGALRCGVLICLVAAAAFALGALPEGAGTLTQLTIAAIVALAGFLTLDAVPKRLQIEDFDPLLLRLIWPLRLIVAGLAPVCAVGHALVDVALALAGFRGGEPARELTLSEGLRETVDSLHKEGMVEKSDRDMLGGLLDLRELTIADVMIHRTKMLSIDLSLDAGAIVHEVLAAPYTRIPVWKDEPDNIVGILHAKDLLRALEAAGHDASKLDIADVALPPWFVPDTTALLDQLRAFRRRKMHFAIVVDEYGVMVGVVTLEDIIEEIVGDIADEHDVVASGVRPQRDGSFNIDGTVPIRDLNRAMDWELPDDEATTLAGLVIHEARTIPETKQTFTFHGFRFQVLRKQRNRIVVLKVTQLERAGGER